MAKKNNMLHFKINDLKIRKSGLPKKSNYKVSLDIVDVAFIIT